MLLAAMWLLALSLLGTTASAHAEPGPVSAPTSQGRNPGEAQPVAPPVATKNEPAAQQQSAHPKQQSAPVTLGTVEVKGVAVGDRAEAQRLLTPGSVHIINGGTFTQRPVSNIADALRYVPGVMVNSNTGGDDGILSIRGSNLTALNYDNSGVLLLQNGLPVTTAGGANHNRLLNPLAARNVIVAEGANALVYGASDLGGAINIISRTARNSDPHQIYLYGGSYGQRGGRISTGGVWGRLDGMVTLASKHFTGWRQHSRENRTNIYGNVGWQVNDQLDLRAYGTYIDSRQQLAGSVTRSEFDTNRFMADPSYLLGNHQLNVRTARMAVTGKWQIDSTSWLDFGASYGLQSLYHPIVDVFNFSTTPPQHFFSLLISTVQRTSGGMARYHLKAGKHNVLVGVNLAYTVDRGGNYQNHAGAKGARTDDVYQRAGKATFFALDRWRFAPRWTLVYGTQATVTNRNVRDVSLVSHAVRDQRATYQSVNPRLGLIYGLAPQIQLFANASRVYEPPNSFELNNDVTQNDSTLKATQGTSFEIGSRSGQPVKLGDGDQLHWSLSLYYAKIRDEVLSVENPAEPGKTLSTNYPQTIHAGISAVVGGDFSLGSAGNVLSPLMSATWNDFKFRHDPTFGDNRLPSAPRYVVHGQLMYRNRPSGFYAGPTFNWVGSRYADMANSYRVGGYFTLGLRVGMRRNGWQVFVAGRNLANKHYVNAVTVLTQATPDARVLNPGAPRTLFVGLEIHY